MALDFLVGPTVPHKTVLVNTPPGFAILIVVNKPVCHSSAAKEKNSSNRTALIALINALIDDSEHVEKFSVPC